MRMALEWEFCKQFSTKRSKKRTPEPRYDVLPMDLENEFVITDNGEGGRGGRYIGILFHTIYF